MKNFKDLLSDEDKDNEHAIRCIDSIFESCVKTKADCGRLIEIKGPQYKIILNNLEACKDFCAVHSFKLEISTSRLLYGEQYFVKFVPMEKEK